jgi:hypothetical protein
MNSPKPEPTNALPAGNPPSAARHKSDDRTNKKQKPSFQEGLPNNQSISI